MGLPGWLHLRAPGAKLRRRLLIAGLPQAPSAYDPLEHYSLAKLRQGHVLAQLVANHAIIEARRTPPTASPSGCAEARAMEP